MAQILTVLHQLQFQQGFSSLENYRMTDDWEAEVFKKEPWEEAKMDEADDVKDSWDIEDEAPEEEVPKPKKSEAKKTIPPKEQPQPTRELTKEERDIAVQVADLNNAMDLFGIKGIDARDIVEPPKAKPAATATVLVVPDVMSLGAKDPATIPEFEALAKKLAAHLNQKFASSQHYPLFLETLIRHSMTERDVTEVRKVAAVLNDIANKAKKPAVKKKASLAAAPKKGSDIDFADYGDVYDDYD